TTAPSSLRSYSNVEPHFGISSGPLSSPDGSSGPSSSPEFSSLKRSLGSCSTSTPHKEWKTPGTTLHKGAVHACLRGLVYQDE
ncbi:hypothetical protein Leryth_022175, partial [Lithospermum erythrorhizon]